jgi:hypothetical protein
VCLNLMVGPTICGLFTYLGYGQVLYTKQTRDNKSIGLVLLSIARSLHEEHLLVHIDWLTQIERGHNHD